jgi:hypothetical protein
MTSLTLRNARQQFPPLTLLAGSHALSTSVESARVSPPKPSPLFSHCVIKICSFCQVSYWNFKGILDSANFYALVVPVRRRLQTVAGGKVVNSMRTYIAQVFIPQVIEIEAEDETQALEKVGEHYKACYTKDFRTLIEQKPRREDY